MTVKLAPTLNSNGTGGALTITNLAASWTGNVTAGDTIFAIVAISPNPTGNIATGVTITDDDPAGSNTYSLQYSIANNSGALSGDKCWVGVFKAVVQTGGRMPVLTVSIPSQTGATFNEGGFSAITESGSWTLDTNSPGGTTNDGGGTTCNTGTTGTPAASGELGIAVATDCGNTLTITTGSGAGTIGGAGFTKDATISQDGNGTQDWCVAINASVGASAVGGTFTFSVDNDNKAAIVGLFKQAAVAATPPLRVAGPRRPLPTAPSRTRVQRPVDLPPPPRYGTVTRASRPQSWPARAIVLGPPRGVGPIAGTSPPHIIVTRGPQFLGEPRLAGTEIEPFTPPITPALPITQSRSRQAPSPARTRVRGPLLLPVPARPLVVRRAPGPSRGRVLLTPVPLPGQAPSTVPARPIVLRLVHVNTRGRAILTVVPYGVFVPPPVVIVNQWAWKFGSQKEHWSIGDH